MAEIQAYAVIHPGIRYSLYRWVKARREAVPHVALLLTLAALSTTAAVLHPTVFAAIFAAL